MADNDNKLTKKERQEYYDSKIIESKKRERINSGFAVAKVFAVVVLFVIIVTVLRFDGQGNIGNIPTFTSLLEMLSSMPSIEFDWFIPSFLEEEWAILDFIRQYFYAILSVIQFIGEGIWAVLSFILVIIRWIFILP